MKYSLEEIDFMRWAIGILRIANNESLECWDNRQKFQGCPFGDGTKEALEERDVVESRLRTLMTSGTEPEELASKVRNLPPVHPIMNPENKDRWPTQFEKWKVSAT